MLVMFCCGIVFFPGLASLSSSNHNIFEKKKNGHCYTEFFWLQCIERSCKCFYNKLVVINF